MTIFIFCLGSIIFLILIFESIRQARLCCSNLKNPTTNSQLFITMTMWFVFHFQHGLARISSSCWYTRGPRLYVAPSQCTSMISKAGKGLWQLIQWFLKASAQKGHTSLLLICHWPNQATAPCLASGRGLRKQKSVVCLEGGE